MFSLKLSCLPSSDERFQCEDEGISAYPSALTPAVATFQGQTEWVLAGLPHFALVHLVSLWQHTPVGVIGAAC